MRFRWPPLLGFLIFQWTHLLSFQWGLNEAFSLTFASRLLKVTYYEERMLEVEDELGRVKEDRRQASIQVKIYFITTVFRSRLARSLSFAIQFSL